MSQKKKVFYGWWVLAALFLVGMLGPMGRYTLTAFGPFISQELGWGATSIGLALSINLWVYAFASILVGWMIDRIGSQRVIFLGGVLLLIGLLGFSKVHKLWQLYATVGVIVGTGIGMTHFLTTQSTARKWFTQKAGLAGGLLTTAFWIGAGVLTPLLTGFANSWGWRSACLFYALSAGIIIMLLAKLVIRDTPESIGLHPDGQTQSVRGNRADLPTKETNGNVKEALTTSSFWMIFFGYSLIGVPAQGLLGHLVLWGVALGAPKATAGLFLTAYTLSSALPPIFGGWLADRIGKRRVLGIGYGISAILLIAAWQTVQSPQSLMVFVALIGVAYGTAAGPGLWTAYLGDLFGRDSVGRLLGILTLGYGLISGTGPLMWGRIYDVTGSYNLACLISAFCLIIIIIFLALAKPVSEIPRSEKRDRQRSQNLS
jgi:MFS family permease